MLARLKYTGLIEVEFKRDRRDGRYKLLDLNPRIWGWNSLSAKAGVDFPYLFWRLSRREPVTEIRGIPNVRWIRMTTDLPAALGEFSRGNLSLSGYLKSFRPPLEFAVFARDDPMPWLLEVPLLSVAKWKRRAQLKAVRRTGPIQPAELPEVQPEVQDDRNDRRSKHCSPNIG